MKTPELEIIIAEHFGIRQNLIVPNVSWGWGLNYEADLVVVTRSRCAYEVELKVSKSDLRADLKKKHHHDGAMFKGLWFAMPESVYDSELVPDQAGVLLVKTETVKNWKNEVETHKYVHVEKKPEVTRTKISEKKYMKLLELAAMRVWTQKKAMLKQKLITQTEWI